jgi:DNA-binding response OmpR family regulator
MIKILIIEGNAPVRENIAELLELNHFRVIASESGSYGYESAKLNIPDIVICDILMPNTKGEMYLNLAERDDLLNSIPIIFLSDDSIEPKVQKGRISRNDTYLQKPFSAEALLSAINKSLDKKIVDAA